MKQTSFFLSISLSFPRIHTHTFLSYYIVHPLSFSYVSHALSLYSTLPKSLPMSLALSHSSSLIHVLFAQPLSVLLYHTCSTSHTHTLLSLSLSLSHLLPFILLTIHDYISRPSKSSSLNTLISQSHAGRSRRLVYQAYLQHLSAGFGLGSFIGNIHLHSSSSIVDTRQTGTYLFSLSHSLSFALFLSVSRTLVLSFIFSHSLSR